MFVYVLVLVLSVPMVAVARAGAGGGGGGSGGVVVTPVPVPIEEPVVEDGPDEDSDRPDWAGRDGTGDTPGRTNDEPGIAMGDLYGDLYIILRDINGEPILSAEGFVQPIDVNGELIPLDAEGAIQEGYSELAQEVEFGRLNLVRAPNEVIDQAYEEALGAINGASNIGLDPAGRLLLTSESGVKAIDSPRENLALYRELMLNGYLPGVTPGKFGNGLAHLGEGSPVLWEKADLDRAASFLAAAADKGGFISVDKVVYVNSFLGINTVEAGYFDFVTFAGLGYTYQRANAYNGVTATLLQPVLSSDPGNGMGEDYFVIRNGVNIYDKVFSGADYGPSEAGVAGFVQASDDALKTVTYIHNWEVPEY